MPWYIPFLHHPGKASSEVGSIHSQPTGKYKGSSGSKNWTEVSHKNPHWRELLSTTVMKMIGLSLITTEVSNWALFFSPLNVSNIIHRHKFIYIYILMIVTF